MGKKLIKGMMKNKVLSFYDKLIKKQISVIMSKMRISKFYWFSSEFSDYEKILSENFHLLK